MLSCARLAARESCEVVALKLFSLFRIPIVYSFFRRALVRARLARARNSYAPNAWSALLPVGAGRGLSRSVGSAIASEYEKVSKDFDPQFFLSTFRQLRHTPHAAPNMPRMPM